MLSLHKIIAQHPDSVALSFLKYKIDAPVNVETLRAAIAAKGQPFIDDLSNVIANQYEVFNGLFGVAGALAKKLVRKKNRAAKKAVRQSKRAKLKSVKKAKRGGGIFARGAASGLMSGAKDALTQSDVASLTKDFEQPAHEETQAVKGAVKKSLLESVGGIVSDVRDTASSIENIVNPKGNAGDTEEGADEDTPVTSRPGGGSKTPAKKSGFLDGLGGNKTLIIAVVIIVILMVIFFSLNGSKKIVK